MPVLHFSSDRALLRKEGLRKDDEGAAYFWHTNNYRLLVVGL